MTAITDTKKRSRDEDSCDFMPISKRIHSLSINNPYGFQDEQLTCPSEHFDQNHNINLLNNYANGVIHSNLNMQHYQFEQNLLESGRAQNQHHIHHQTANSNFGNNIIQNNSNSNSHHNVGAISMIGHHHTQQSQQQQQQQQQPQSDQLQLPDEFNMENYNPELTADENPFYYNKNKLLFDLHIERARRYQLNSD